MLRSISSAITILLLCCTITAYSQDMKAWTDYMTPGDVHKMLAKSDGDWTTDVSLWMEPGKPPMKSQGVCTYKMILGGRYQQSTFKGMMMGMPFEGSGMLAYDNVKKTFYSTWVDTFGTGIMNLEGKWDDATKSMTLTGKSFDPALNKDVDVKQKYTIVDDKHEKMEMFMVDGQNEMKTMEILFARK
jgi:Protein of unknown function (DUF1579)